MQNQPPTYYSGDILAKLPVHSTLA